MTSALIGASSVAQIEENAAVVNRLGLDEPDLQAIEAILRGQPEA